MALYRFNALDAAVKGAFEQGTRGVKANRVLADGLLALGPPSAGPSTPRAATSPVLDLRAARLGQPGGESHPRPRTITAGAARAWWPIQSSKLAGPGSPRLGRFDSFAASSLEIRGFDLIETGR